MVKIPTLTEEEKKVIISQYVAIQKGASTNMYDKNMVQIIASRHDFHELVVFIEDGYYMWIFENYNVLAALINKEDIEPVRVSFDVNRI